MKSRKKSITGRGYIIGEVLRHECVWEKHKMRVWKEWKHARRGMAGETAGRQTL